MATYYARDGTPVHTAFALPENSRGEVTRYTTHGRQRLYTKARLDELDRRAVARKAPRTNREKTMSEQALDLVKAEFEEFCILFPNLIERIGNFHKQDETLAVYWQAINHGLALSPPEQLDALRRIRKLR